MTTYTKSNKEIKHTKNVGQSKQCGLPKTPPTPTSKALMGVGICHYAHAQPINGLLILLLC